MHCTELLSLFLTEAPKRDCVMYIMYVQKPFYSRNSVVMPNKPTELQPRSVTFTVPLKLAMTSTNVPRLLLPSSRTREGLSKTTHAEAVPGLLPPRSADCNSQNGQTMGALKRAGVEAPGCYWSCAYVLSQPSPSFVDPETKSNND